jgi:arsenite methyltransferase
MESRKENIKKIVKESYGKIATKGISCCSSSKCCSNSQTAEAISEIIGYSKDEINAVPEGANLGLGCGNPLALAELKEGAIVLDLGSGAGFDAFLAAMKVGNIGRVIGVDMTPEMIAKAKENAIKGKYNNVEFRLGEIEKLPVADSSIDVIISNCVINLSPDKEIVFKEAFRVLKPGGRLMVSDLVLIKDLPHKLKTSVEAYVGCLAGAINKDNYLSYIKLAGFHDIKVISETGYPADALFEGLEDAKNAISSIKVSAVK